MALINKKHKIFLAGSTGMVGSAIKRKLNHLGFNNLVLPNRSELDLKDTGLVFDWFKKNKPDIVILSAAKVGGIYANNAYPVEFLLDNLKIQNNVIEASWKNKVKRLLFLGSSCIYPKFAKQPIQEEELLNGLLEKTNESYALAKISGIKLCSALRKQYGFDAISLMPTNLYGPGDNYHKVNSHVFASFIRKFIEAKTNNRKKVVCWGSGMVYREFLHVDDLGDACCFVLQNWDPNAEDAPKTISGDILDYLNVGTGSDITVKELSKLVAEFSGFKGIIEWDKTKPDGTPRKKLDITRIEKIGWSPKVSLEEGIKKTILQYKEEVLKD